MATPPGEYPQDGTKVAAPGICLEGLHRDEAGGYFVKNKRIKGSYVIWPSKLLCFNHSHTDGCFNTCQAWKRLVFLIRWAFAKRFHERNIIQCRSASLGSGVSTLARSECHRHNQTWYGFQPELGKNWQPVQNTRNLFRCQPNQSSRRFVVRPRWEKGLAKRRVFQNCLGINHHISFLLHGQWHQQQTFWLAFR